MNKNIPTESKVGDIPKKKKKKIDTRTAAKETFNEFCSCTSVHGVQYIGVRKRFDRYRVHITLDH